MPIKKFLKKASFAWFAYMRYQYLQYIFRVFRFSGLNDKDFCDLKFSKKYGKNIDFENPKTFNEKIQWLKIYDKREITRICTDKLLVRDYVKKKLGKDICPRVIKIYDKASDIKASDLPKRFVLKTNHGSGMNIICHDRDKFNLKIAKIKLNVWMKIDWYKKTRAYGCKNIERKIICEELIDDGSGKTPNDYKFFCFNGVPKYIEFDFDRYEGHKRNMYDINWNFLDFRITYPNDPQRMNEKPKLLEKATSYAKKLSEDFPFARVDFYLTDSEIYLGEITLYHDNGFTTFIPEIWNEKFGDEFSVGNNNYP